MIFKGSRYERVPVLEHTDPSGRVVPYLGLRQIPPTPVREEHVVTEGQRLDHVAHLRLRDSERFWRICDANAALWPPDLVAEPGRRIGIPAAEG